VQDITICQAQVHSEKAVHKEAPAPMLEAPHTFGFSTPELCEGPRAIFQARVAPSDCTSPCQKVLLCGVERAQNQLYRKKKNNSELF